MKGETIMKPKDLQKINEIYRESDEKSLEQLQKDISSLGCLGLIVIILIVTVIGGSGAGTYTFFFGIPIFLGISLIIVPIIEFQKKSNLKSYVLPLLQSDKA